MRDSVPVADRAVSQETSEGLWGFSLGPCGWTSSDLIDARASSDQRDCHGMVSARRMAVAMTTNPLMAETTPSKMQ